MKKLTVLLASGLLLSNALYANNVSQQNNHMGDHMHEGKMTNHMNMNGMSDEEMKKLHNSMHKKHSNNYQKEESPAEKVYKEWSNAKNLGDGRDIDFK